MLAVAGPGEKLLVSRNAHKSVAAGLIISGVAPVWVHPRWDAERHFAYPPEPDTVREAFDRAPDATAHDPGRGLTRHSLHPLMAPCRLERWLCMGCFLVGTPGARPIWTSRLVTASEYDACSFLPDIWHFMNDPLPRRGLRRARDHSAPPRRAAAWRPERGSVTPVGLRSDAQPPDQHLGGAVRCVTVSAFEPARLGQPWLMSVVGRMARLRSAYAGEQERPLTGYLAALATYVGLVGLVGVIGRRRGARIPKRFSPGDILLLSVATHKASRLLTKSSVTSAVRAPVARYRQSAGEGEVNEAVRGNGIRHSVGELLTCPFCAGTWIASGLTAGLVLAPDITRLAATTLTVIAGSDFLHLGYDAAKKLARDQ